MPIEPVKIPQNVYVEDRIVGPITLRHIIMLLIGGGVSYVLWAIFKQAGLTDLISTIIAWTPMAIMAAFAFVKINNISLFRFCLLMIERAEKPSLRVWTPRRGLSINIQFIPKDEHAQKQKTVVHKNTERIAELSQVLDLGPEEDITEESEQEEPLERKTQPSPVDPSKIAVSPIASDAAPLDGVQNPTKAHTAQKKNPVTTDTLMRDIRPSAAS